MCVCIPLTVKSIYKFNKRGRERRHNTYIIRDEMKQSEGNGYITSETVFYTS